MKKFKKNLLRILGLLAIFCGLSYVMNQYLFRTTLPIVPEDKTVVSCGVSFSQFALNDKEIPNFKNYSMKGRTGLGIYKAVQALVENNPHLEAVVLDFAILAVSKYRDYKFFLPVFAPSEFYNVYPLTDFFDLKAYPLNYKYYLKNQMRYEWVPNLEYLEIRLERLKGDKNETFPYLGHYDPHDGVNLDKLNEWSRRLKQMQRLSGEEAPLSEIDFTYTDSIYNYLRKKDVEMVIFCPPMHEDIMEILPVEYIILFDQIVDEMEEREKLHLLDFSNFELRDSFFFNHTHVNRKGSELISHAFARKLKEINLIKAGKQ